MFKFITATLLFSLALAGRNESIVPIKFRLRQDKDVLQLCLGDTFKIDGLDDKNLLDLFGNDHKVKCKFNRNDKKGKDIVNLLAFEDGINSKLIIDPTEKDDDKIIINLKQLQGHGKHHRPELQNNKGDDYYPK